MVHGSLVAAGGLCRPRLAWLTDADTEHRWHWCWQHIALSLHSAHVISREQSRRTRISLHHHPNSISGLRLSSAHLLCAKRLQDHRPSIGSLQKHLQFSTCPNDLLHKVLHGATEQQGFFYAVCSPPDLPGNEGGLWPGGYWWAAPHMKPRCSVALCSAFLQQCCQDHQMSDTASCLGDSRVRRSAPVGHPGAIAAASEECEGACQWVPALAQPPAQAHVSIDHT